ncbi:MAG: DNA topoisomerase VI subunit B [Hadesarchaea archaeon]|nr:DNA topoisomerase VI subunit B [Hadesarchaea archaeon]
MVLAKDIFKEFKEHSVSEFFRKNAAMLGYTGKIRSLTTVIHEGVTNAIDAAEDAGILPEIFVTIKELDGSNHYKVIIEDNASGIPEEYIPRVFGRMLAGTKLHRNIQSRGQQGIGISGSVMFSQSTSGEPTKVMSSTGDGEIVSYEVMIDVEKNEGKIMNQKTMEGDWRGTRIEFEIKDVLYHRSRYGPYNYLRMTAMANPHLQIRFLEPDGSFTIFERATEEIPERPEPITPHPAGVRADDLLALSKLTKSRSIGTFLVNELSRFSRNRLEELEEKIDVDLDEEPSELTWNKAEKIVSAFKEIDFMSPPTKGLRPIGEEKIERGLEQVLDPEFAYATTRSPEVYSGGIPFIIETGIAYGGNAGAGSNSEEEKGMELLRFANRAPLIFNQGGCAVRAAARDIDWRRYNVDPEKTPISLFINVVSVHVPYTSAGKQSVAEEPEIYEDIRQAIMQSARKLKSFLRGKIKKKERRERAGIFKKYLPIIVERAAKIAGKDSPDPDPLIKEIAGAEEFKEWMEEQYEEEKDEEPKDEDGEFTEEFLEWIEERGGKDLAKEYKEEAKEKGGESNE